MRFHPKFRFFLLMLAFGLASARFFSYIYESWSEVQVDLPQVRSETPIFIFPRQVITEEYLKKSSFISEDKDLSLFDKGEEFSNCENHGFNQLEFKDCRKRLIKTRDFIFNHWKTKKRAHIIYEVSGSDCSATKHIFIEPNKNGEWRIIFVSELFGFGSETIKDNLDLSNSSSVKFKRATKDDYPFGIGTYYLSFIDENGKEVEGL